MDRIWQWVWDRYGARYTWVIYAVGFAVTLAVYLLLTLLIAAFEKSGHYVEVTAVTAGAALLFECMLASPRRRMRLAEQWAAGQEIDRATALEGTYSYARRLSSQMAWSTGVWAAVLSVVVGAIAGATGPRLVQYGILGAVYGTGVDLIAFHNIVEAALRPARVALAGNTGIGDSRRVLARLLPRDRTCPWLRSRSHSPINHSGADLADLVPNGADWYFHLVIDNAARECGVVCQHGCIGVGGI